MRRHGGTLQPTRHGQLPSYVCALAVVGCEAARAESSEPAQRRAEPMALPAAELFSAGRTPVLTGWEATPERLDSDQCRTCHAATHEAWAGGTHAQAWRDPLFTRAFAREPRQWCKNCHAPLVVQHAGSVPLEQGINCAACHVRGGEVLGPRARAASTGVHAVSASAGFAGPALCEGCHQFNFPTLLGESVEYSDLPMQNTLEEWRAARAPACNECHTGGHALRGPQDAAWLQRLVTRARWAEPAEGLLSLELQLRPRGHSFPTGDLFHAFVLEVCREPGCARPLVRKRYGRELGKGFVSAFLVSDRAVLRDTSLPAASPGLSITFDRPDAGRLFARLRFFRQDGVLDRVSSPEEESATTVWEMSYEPGGS